MCIVWKKNTREDAKYYIEVVQNELLAYAVYYLQCCTYEYVELSVLDIYFGSGDVRESKYVP